MIVEQDIIEAFRDCLEAIPDDMRQRLVRLINEYKAAGHRVDEIDLISEI